MILKNHASMPIRKERLSLMTKARRKASRNEFMERGGCQTESKALPKSIVARIVRARPGFVKTDPKWTEKGTEFDLE